MRSRRKWVSEHASQKGKLSTAALTYLQVTRLLEMCHVTVGCLVFTRGKIVQKQTAVCSEIKPKKFRKCKAHLPVENTELGRRKYWARKTKKHNLYIFSIWVHIDIIWTYYHGHNNMDDACGAKFYIRFLIWILQYIIMLLQM